MTPEAFIPTEPIIRSEVTDPATVAALQNFGINPIGKSIEEIENEINAILAREQRRVAFDPTDPLDYLSAGLTASGVGTGVGLGIKGLRTARKAKKLNETLQMGNLLKGALAALNPIKVTTKTASQGRIVPSVGPPGPFKTIATSTQVTPKIPQTLLYSGEIVQAQDVAAAERQADKIQESLDEITASNAINGQPEGGGEEIDGSVTLTEQTQTEGGEEQEPELGDTKIGEDGKTYIYTAAGYVLMPDKSKPSVSELFRKKDINRFLRNVGAALVETGDFTGLAKGAAKTAEERAAEELATSLAEIEAGKKERPTQNYIEDRKVGYQDTFNEYKKGENTIDLLSNVIRIASSEDLGGAKALLKEFGYRVFTFIDPNTAPDVKTLAGNILEEIARSQPGPLLGQSTGRLSDRDIILAEQLLATIKGPKGAFKSQEEIINILTRRLATLNGEQNSRLTKIANDEIFFRDYGVTTPVLIDDEFLSAASQQDQNQEVERIPLQEPEEETAADQFAASR
jgi:hypothetical protein